MSEMSIADIEDAARDMDALREVREIIEGEV